MCFVFISVSLATKRVPETWQILSRDFLNECTDVKTAKKITHGITFPTEGASHQDSKV